MDTRAAALRASILALTILPLAMPGSGELYGQYAGPSKNFEASPQPSGSMVLEEMTRSAGVIFTGEVLAVRRLLSSSASSEDTATGVVEVVFRVDQALRGCANGSVYTLREWAGLWTGPTDRYRPGQRLLMFLHSVNPGELSSTVHGMEGAIPLRGGGAAPGSDESSSAAAEWFVDLRWVKAQTPRQRIIVSRKPIWWPVHSAMVEAAEGDAAIVPGEERDSTGGEAILPTMPRIVAPRPSETVMAPLSQVLNLCRSWMRQTSDAR